MLRKSTGRGDLTWRAPWLRTSSGIFCLCLTFWLDQVGLLQGHPQCLDYGPPFRPLFHLEFCSDYKSFGCCDHSKDLRIAARYWDIMDYFDLKGHELCGSYIKDILCQVGLRVARNPAGSRGAGLGTPQGFRGAWPVAWLLGEGSLGTQPSGNSPANCVTLELWALDRYMEARCAEFGSHWFPKAFPLGLCCSWCFLRPQVRAGGHSRCSQSSCCQGPPRRAPRAGHSSHLWCLWVYGGSGGTCWGPVLIWVVCAGGPGVMMVVTGVGGAVPSIPELDWESFRQLSGSDSQVLFLLALRRPKPTCLAGITHAGYRLHRLGMRHRKSRQEDL